MNFFMIKNPLYLKSAYTKRISCFLFYLSFFMYVIASVLRDTTLKYDYADIYSFLLNFYWIPIWIAIVNILFFTDYTIGQLCIYIIFAVVYWVSYRNYANYRLYHSFLILLSARHIEWKNFIKKALILYGTLLLVVFFGYCFDLLKSVDIYYRGDEVRWTLGFVHPNLLGGYIMVFAMLWVTERYENFNFWDAIVVLALAAFTWKGPASRTSSLIMGILLFFAIISKKYGKWLLKNAITRLAIIYIYPLCFLFIFCCSYLYDEKNVFLVKLDAILSGRVRFGHLFLDKYYHTWFGQKIKQINNRTAMLTGKSAMYLDSSYMRLYVGVGIVGCLITLWIFTRIMRYAVENARWDIISGSIAMAIYGISELYITYIHWNFYLIVFASLPAFQLTGFKLETRGWGKKLFFARREK